MSTPPDSQIIPDNIWITGSAFACIATVINLKILRTELTKRKNQSTSFASPSMKILSLLCIGLAPLSTFLAATGFLNISCYIAGTLHVALSESIFLLLISYQISRLYYCFATSKIYSNKGYPNWVFITMYSIAIITNINLTFVTFGESGIPKYCGIDNKLEYEIIYGNSQYLDDLHQYTSIWTGCLSLIGIFLDIITLLMYIWKIHEFKKRASNERVYKRIMRILTKMVIISVFYEFAFWMILIVYIITEVIFGYGLTNTTLPTVILNVICSYSMSLMMEHNKMEYMQLLRIVHTLRMDYLCCCYRPSVIEHLSDNQHQLEEEIKTNEEKETENDETYETHDISCNHAKVQQQGIEISVESKPVPVV